MTTMSITRAIVELKRLNSRIENAISGGKFVAKTVGKNSFKKVVGANDSVESMSAKIQASFDSVESLIEMRGKIKAAIVLSNATTKVTVMEKEMSVAEAIELKSTITFRHMYLRVLQTQLAREMVDVEKANMVLDSTIEVSLNSIYGSEKTKISEDVYKSVANPQKEQKEAALLDPMKIEDKIKKLTEQISIIESEVDFTLSESNAKTVITV